MIIKKYKLRNKILTYIDYNSGVYYVVYGRPSDPGKLANGPYNSYDEAIKNAKNYCQNYCGMKQELINIIKRSA